MKAITDRLWKALTEVVGMKHPSVARLLRGSGFGYEADRMDELSLALQEQEWATPTMPEGETLMQTACDVIRKLLSAPELNDDEIDRETREIISMARAFIEKP